MAKIKSTISNQKSGKPGMKGDKPFKITRPQGISSGKPGMKGDKPFKVTKPKKKYLRFGINGGILPKPQELPLPPRYLEEIETRLEELNELNVDIIRQLIYADALYLWPCTELQDSDFIYMDELVRVAHEKNIKIILTLYSMNKDLDGYFSNTTERENAEAYVKKIVERYQNYNELIYWEIGNELIIQDNVDKNKINKVCEIITLTYNWIKSADSKATVLMPGLAGTTEEVFKNSCDAFKKLLSNQCLKENKSFDIAHYHYYNYCLKDLEDSFLKFKNVVGVSKTPIWVTETAIPSETEDKTMFGECDLETQARHVVKKFVILFNEGAETVMWHSYMYTSEGLAFYQCNINTPALNPKPSYYTYQIMTEKLDNFVAVGKIEHESNEIYKFEFDDERDPVYVIWWKTIGDKKVDLREFISKDSVVRITKIIESENQTEPETAVYKTKTINTGDSPIFVEIAK